jgi:manganese oxidase
MLKNRITRRNALLSGATALAGAAVMRDIAAAQTRTPTATLPSDAPPMPPAQPGRDYTPVVTPNNIALPWKIIEGVKVYHLIAEPVRHEIAPGLVINAWGYNGRCHGPTIEAVEGDRVRIYVTNTLRAPTSVHWHGILLPNGMDGVGGLNQKPIAPGETFRYEFTLRQRGTFMYHSHHDEMTQMAMGMVGLFVIHPRNVPAALRPERDFALLLHEWAIRPGTATPDPNVMSDFNVLTINARAFPGTESLVVRRGQRVRIRFGNLGPMDHHPIHLHGHDFTVTNTDGGDVPLSAQRPEATVLVAVGSTRTVDFVANEPGDWAMHCHMTHHVMNQMGHDIPNTIGIDPRQVDEKIRPLIPAYMTMGQEGMGEMHLHHGMKMPQNSIPMVGGDGPFGYITMGGMFSIVKVREGIQTFEDPGWYAHPPGTVASAATGEELRRDGIDVEQPPGTATSRPAAEPDHHHH